MESNLVEEFRAHFDETQVTRGIAKDCQKHPTSLKLPELLGKVPGDLQ
jgi:hypothetical protein